MICKQIAVFLFACSSFFLSNHQMPAEGMNEETPLFDETQALTPIDTIDEQLLVKSFDSAIDISDIKEPEQAQVLYYEDQVIFHIVEKTNTTSITCHFHGDRPHCALLDDESVQDIATNPHMGTIA